MKCARWLLGRFPSPQMRRPLRDLRPSEFDEEDALMSLLMDVGAKESAQQQGRRVELPLEGEVELDAQVREEQRQRYGVDPLDVEAMLCVSYPRP